jgi:aminoacylase
MSALAEEQPQQQPSAEAGTSYILSAMEQEDAVAKLVKIIQFPTVSTSAYQDNAYNECAAWLMAEMQAMGGLSGVHILPESVPNKPVVVGTWLGSQPELPAILLNSHYDVVPVIPEGWTVPAFDGLVRDGRVYGRGAQDMKCVCIQYLVAIRKLVGLGFRPTRTVHLSYLPDEEVGGLDGMNVLLRSDWYAEFEVAVALDEGLANEGDRYSVFYGERLPWWVKIKANGNTGHGSRFIEGTAVEQLVGVSQKVLNFREEQRQILHKGGMQCGCNHAVAAKTTLGDVTSMNITLLRAGTQAGGEDVYNVIPSTAEAAIDIRLSPHTEPQSVIDTLDLWCEEVSRNTVGLKRKEGHGVQWEFIHKNVVKQHSLTSTDTKENVWYGIMQQTLQTQFGIDITPQVFPAATDSRFLRALGVKALGFSPMRRSPILLHEHDEYLGIDVFVEGCNVFVQLIRNMSDKPVIVEQQQPPDYKYTRTSLKG